MGQITPSFPFSGSCFVSHILPYVSSGISAAPVLSPSTKDRFTLEFPVGMCCIVAEVYPSVVESAPYQDESRRLEGDPSRFQVEIPKSQPNSMNFAKPLNFKLVDCEN